MRRFIELLSRAESRPDPLTAPMAAKQALAAEAHRPLPRHGRSAGSGRGVCTPVQRGQLPTEIPEIRWNGDGETIWVSRLIAEAGLAKSNSEARRLVVQGGVRIDGRSVKDPQLEIPCQGAVLLEIGKRRIARVRFD